MNPAEIRAIRGSLSRAAFAHLLGVTALTVLRWELPEGSKEARRPRAKTIDSLRRLAGEGVGLASHVAEFAVAGDGLGMARAFSTDEAREGESSPPPGSAGAVLYDSVAPGPGSTRRLRESAAPDGLPQGHRAFPESLGLTRATRADEERVRPLLGHINGPHWRGAEDELLALLSAGSLTTHLGRSLALLGLVQIQLLARLDTRGALAVLLPLLADGENGLLPRAVAGRAHVLAAVLFAAPDSRTCDAGRVNVHASRAEELLGDDDDMRVMCAAARVAGARFLGLAMARSAYQTHLPSLQRVASPLAHVLAAALHALVGTEQTDLVSIQLRVFAAVEAANRLGFWGVTIGIVADYAARALRSPTTPEFTLDIVRRGRDLMRKSALAPTEPQLRLLGAECEALCRLARLDEALGVAQEALQLAERGGLARHALAAPLGRLFGISNRVVELRTLAELLDSDCPATVRPPLRVHAAFVRGLLAVRECDFASAIELFASVCDAPDATLGIDDVRHDAYFELISSYIFARRLVEARTALRRAEAFNEIRPSVWHSAIFRRGEALLLFHSGRLTESRQKIEATRATFSLLGDLLQTAFDDAALSLLASAGGAPEASALVAAGIALLAKLGVSSDWLKHRARIVTAPLVESWREPSSAEKLAVAIERLSVRGLTVALFRHELRMILQSFFPERDVVLGGREVNDENAAIVEANGFAEGGLRFGVRGEVDAEQRAVLLILASFSARIFAQPPAEHEPVLAVDSVLPGFIAAAPATRQLKGEIARLSRSTATILITGESGSGKEVVARAVHDLSARSDKPYVAFNCASVPRDLFESQLFGFRKGAFTGAGADSLGVIRAADGGTLFLDEVGELPLETQPKLLRFLENSEIFPLGEQKPRRVDVRILAATHRDLGRLVREGRFREDLYYRLNVVPLHVPPLRERIEDVMMLARVFIERLAADGAASPALGPDAVRALESHSWPGNVRELRNVIERAMAYSPVPSVLSAAQLRITGV